MPFASCLSVSFFIPLQSDVMETHFRRYIRVRTSTHHVSDYPHGGTPLFQFPHVPRSATLVPGCGILLYIYRFLVFTVLSRSSDRRLSYVCNTISLLPFSSLIPVDYIYWKHVERICFSVNRPRARDQGSIEDHNAMWELRCHSAYREAITLQRL